MNAEAQLIGVVRVLPDVCTFVTPVFQILAATSESSSPAARSDLLGVVANRSSCEAAIELRNTRFLANDAPTLPLPMCTWPLSCTCRFERYKNFLPDDSHDLANKPILWRHMGGRAQTPIREKVCQVVGETGLVESLQPIHVLREEFADLTPGIRVFTGGLPVYAFEAKPNEFAIGQGGKLLAFLRSMMKDESACAHIGARTRAAIERFAKRETEFAGAEALAAKKPLVGRVTRSSPGSVHRRRKSEKLA